MKITKTLINVNSKTQIGSVNISIDFDTKPRKRKYVNTGVKIHVNNWNKVKGEVKKSDPYHRQNNDLIETSYKEILYSINNLKIQEKKITFKFLSQELEKRNENEKDLNTLIEDYITIRKDLKQIHIKKMENLNTRLKDFIPVLNVDEIDQTFIYNFKKYLETDQPNHTNPNLRKSQNPSTIKKTFDFLKTILRYYLSEGKIEDNFSNLKYPKSFKQKMVILTEMEIKQLMDYQPNINRLKKIKDLILIQIHTGLRFSDLFKINPSQIENGNITIHTEKTNKIVSIPILGNLKSILESYNNNIQQLKISNTKYNKYIKELLGVVGINTPSQTIIFNDGIKQIITKPKFELVGSHTLRRTFVTIGLMKGIPIHIIQSITGHSSIQQLTEYVHIVDEMKRKEMEKMNF